MKDPGEKFLRRYTTLAALSHMLLRRKITLLDPQSWEDRNDAFFMEQYKLRNGLKSVLAICFARGEETHHHWKCFSPGGDGVCIEFDKAKTVAGMGAQGVKCGPVEYRTIEQLRLKPPTIDELPFIKRWPYQNENEYRMIYEDAGKVLPLKECDMELSWIERIHLSPWMPVALADAVKDMIRLIPDCKGKTLNHSKLVDYAQWKDLAGG